MKKLFSLMLLVSVLCVPAFSEGQTKTFTVAYMTPALHIPFWKDISDGIRQEAEKVGVEIIDSDSRLSAATQLQNAQDLITSGVDAIIISPTDSASCPPVLELAEEANVPVIICDIGTDEGNYVSFIISNNYGGAYDAGKYLAQKMDAKGWKGGDVAVITISLARQNGRDRTNGFKDAMAEAGSEVVGLLECKDYTRSESMKLAQDLITAHPNLRGLFTEHDEANLGAMPAIETSGKQDELVHVGFDGSPETVEAIKEGKIGAAAMQQPVLMGREAFKATWKHLNGEMPEKEIVVPTILVTQENVYDIEDQLENNVYPNELKQ
ncbi:substrate-binding domain-containing protein [candidate division KSB3 bacterium]|uniref:Substrate-binding domain-containing protein n=1 Tax=candidate division KSB3 bacterium TaxID=2044937 RepID=A0A9D5JWH5_9BACT|nr:substrate-binding domain-containing protein [candidate division KSB3 bacterium]MBD3325413.1 substrate-binding domain-containing protein [candidate division KSB3 bacterium]